MFKIMKADKEIHFFLWKFPSSWGKSIYIDFFSTSLSSNFTFYILIVDIYRPASD